MSRSITAYRYDPRTREYAGTDVAEESPLEPDIFLMPAHSTRVAPPPVREGNVALYVHPDTWRVTARRSVASAAPLIARATRTAKIARARARIRLARQLDATVEAAYAREAQLEQHLADMPDDVALLDGFDPESLWGAM